MLDCLFNVAVWHLSQPVMPNIISCESMEPASQPLGRVHMDLYSSSIKLIEGYNHSIKLTEGNSWMRWQPGMKTKDETLDMSKRLNAEISDIR